MKTLILIFLMVGLITSASAAKLCPAGKSYRTDLCKEVKTRRDGTVTIHPWGKSYDRENTMVGKPQRDGSMRFCPKGKSYKRDECWVMK